MITYSPPTPPAPTQAPAQAQPESIYASPPRLTYNLSNPVDPNTPPRRVIGFNSPPRPSQQAETGGDGASSSTPASDINLILQPFKRKADVDNLGIGFTKAEYDMMWEMSDLRRRPPKRDAELQSQRTFLVTYAPLLERVKYGDINSYMWLKLLYEKCLA